MKAHVFTLGLTQLFFCLFVCGDVRGGFPGNLATWLLSTSPSTRRLGGVFTKTPGTCPRPIWLFSTWRSSYHLAKLSSAPRTARSRFIVWHTVRIDSSCVSVDAWSPPQAVCHQTWSPLQAGCHHHDTARFNTVQQIPTNRPYLALWGVINNPEPKPILGTPPTTWPSYALRCLPNPWAWGSG